MHFCVEGTLVSATNASLFYVRQTQYQVFYMFYMYYFTCYISYKIYNSNGNNFYGK